MAGLLNVLYSVLILVVTAAGIGYVLWMADFEESEANNSSRVGRGLLTGGLVIYLAAMILGLVI